MHRAISGTILTGFLAGCLGPMPAEGPDARNRVVDIVNTTDAPMQFYARNAERRGAGQTRFGAAEVAARYYLVVNFDDDTGACLFDLYGDFADGRTVHAARFDSCDEISWVIREDMLQ